MNRNGSEEDNFLVIGRDGLGVNGSSAYTKSVKFAEDIAVAMNIQFSSIAAPDGEFGGLIANNSWTGIIGGLLNGSMDISYPELSFREDRAAVVPYFSIYCHYDYFGFILNIKTLQDNHKFVIWQAMKWYLWMFLFLAQYYGNSRFSMHRMMVITGISSYFGVYIFDHRFTFVEKPFETVVESVKAMAEMNYKFITSEETLIGSRFTIEDFLIEINDGKNVGNLDLIRPKITVVQGQTTMLDFIAENPKYFTIHSASFSLNNLLKINELLFVKDRKRTNDILGCYYRPQLNRKLLNKFKSLSTSYCESGLFEKVYFEKELNRKNNQKLNQRLLHSYSPLTVHKDISNSIFVLGFLTFSISMLIIEVIVYKVLDLFKLSFYKPYE